jgi:hypothetical protein
MSKKIDEKICEKCGRTIEYRKKWAKNWSEVKYCSEQCRRRKLTDEDAKYEEQILELLAKRSAGSSICPSEILVSEDKKNHLKMEQVRQAARRLVYKNLIVITQSNRVVDPSAFKGPIRLKRKE